MRMANEKLRLACLIEGRSVWQFMVMALIALWPTTSLAQRVATLQNVTLAKTGRVCDLLGLGAVGSVPFNFPGADASVLDGQRSTLPRIPEASLPAGENPTVPRVFAGDLGAPFEHGDGQLYFTFGDAYGVPSEGIAPHYCSPGAEQCGPWAVNDDVFATAASDGWTSDDDCIDLSIERAGSDPEKFRPITWNGYYNDGGAELGPGIVPGPAFSTGRFIFSLMPGPTLFCSVSRNDCAAVGGIEGDQCLPAGAGDQGRCYFEACANDALSPCGLRLNAMTLAVREQGNNFVTPALGTHITSPDVLSAYRGHFATASFYSQVDFETAQGKVWVVGRDSFWGGPGITMSPYLMYHPVSQGRLEPPLYFAGMNGTEPSFSSDRTAARPIYGEDKLLNQHTSLGYVPELDGGTWVMLYGGHAAAVHRSLIGFFVRPVSDALFYDRNAGIYLRWAKQPWGPWSAPVTIFNPYTSGQGGYCESMYFADAQETTGFHCPFEQAAHNESLNRNAELGTAGEYGAALVPGYTSRSRDGKSVTLHWLMSTSNPYRALLMKSQLSLQVQRPRPPYYAYGSR
jgi:hypothetical protein